MFFSTNTNQISQSNLLIAQNLQRTEIHNLLRSFIPQGYECVKTTYPEEGRLRLEIRTGNPTILKENNALILNQIEVLIALRFGLPTSSVSAVVDAIETPELSAVIQAELMAAKIEEGLPPPEEPPTRSSARPCAPGPEGSRSAWPGRSVGPGPRR